MGANTTRDSGVNILRTADSIRTTEIDTNKELDTDTMEIDIKEDDQADIPEDILEEMDSIQGDQTNSPPTTLRSDLAGLYLQVLRVLIQARGLEDKEILENALVSTNSTAPTLVDTEANALLVK